MQRRILYLFVIALALVLLAPLKSLAGGEALYEDARKAYESLMNSEELKANRANWLKVIARFERVYQEDPNSRAAVKAYYMAGKACAYSYKYHKNRADFDRGRKNLETLIRRYPNDPLVNDAEYFLGELYFKAGDKKMAAYHYRLAMEKSPKGEFHKDARNRLQQLKMWPMPAWLKNYNPSNAPAVAAQAPQTNPQPAGAPAAPAVTETPLVSGRVLVRQIKHLSSGDYTRVIIYCKQKARFSEAQYVKPNPAENVKNPRLFIDILDARLAPGVDKPQPINDGILIKVRAGQFTPDRVRVVMDIDSIDPEQTKVFPMEEAGGDYRIVIDVSAPKKKTGKTAAKIEVEPQKKTIRRIVLDPGHGGKDPGAIGPKGLMEKDVVLSIALKARDFIQNSQKLDVKLTREKDIFLPLEERTAYANMVHIEDETLFISLHTNAAEDDRARGIETYILDTTSDHAAKRLAAIENKVSIETIDAFQAEKGLIFKLFQKAKADESYNLAMDVQKALVSKLKPSYADVGDHGVKEAPFFVLMGAKMPCILVELSFISNPQEEKRLKSPEYQSILAQSLSDGIAEYIKKKNTIAAVAHD